MLTYATIFIASIILAVVAIAFYRVIANSSKSVLSSKGPVSIISSTPNPRKGPTHGTVTSATPALKNHVAPVNVARVTPAMPTGHIDWGWKDSGNQVREQHPHHSANAVGRKHCSLYDVDPTAPAKRDVTWPHREEKHEAGGKAYKVTRKVRSERPNLDDSGKPWGW